MGWIWLGLLWVASWQGTTTWWDPEVPDPLALGESTGFGSSMVLAGSSLIVGAPRSFRDGERGGALWTAPLQALPRVVPLTGLPGQAWFSLGYDLAWQPGRSTLALGAPLAPNDGLNPGWVYLAEATNSSVSSLVGVQTLVPVATSAGAGFGSALAWSGEELWVGAPFAAHAPGQPRIGYVARYSRGTLGWRETARIYAPLLGDVLRFGEALQSGSGWLVIGAPGTPQGGAVCIWSLAAVDGPPEQVLVLPGAGASGAEFGRSLVLAEDGLQLFVGAPSLGVGGEVHAFRRSPGGAFRLAAILRAPELGIHARFGARLAWDRGVLWVGAPGANGTLGSSGAIGSTGAVMAFPRVRAQPSLAQTWNGTAEDQGLGGGLLAHGGGCFLASAGHGVVTFRDAPKGRIDWVLAPASGGGVHSSGVRLDWLRASDGSGSMVAVIDGLIPHETGIWKWVPKAGGTSVDLAGVEGSFQAESTGAARVAWNDPHPTEGGHFWVLRSGHPATVFDVRFL
ncbi:MAG: hypothetical protein H6830_01150 [Planctomycetes bacterium]|nr:hypothetical protein [Planctomycetota bacterium]MCB9911130.1 hypothetical protein [Planctomycetota bacterium]MCB9912137.1 hypothetical protein [Planctomycetota bacterium]HPF13756.1 hypothetical protein [Planctomycetota bacterium]